MIKTSLLTQFASKPCSCHNPPQTAIFEIALIFFFKHLPHCHCILTQPETTPTFWKDFFFNYCLLIHILDDYLWRKETDIIGIYLSLLKEGMENGYSSEFFAI